MKTSATNRRIRILMTAIRDEKLIPRPEFQRRLVWTNRHKEEFLQTVLMNYPFPEIYVASGEVDTETGEGTEMLVDGQQRITTLYQYFTGSSDLILREIRPYAELEKDEKFTFLEYEVVIRDLGNKSIEEIKEVFRRINSTKYSLNAMEVHNARFDGELKKFAEQLAEHSFFSENHVFGTLDIRRMGDLVFSLTAIISVMGGYFNRQDELEEFLAKYNDEFSDANDLRQQFDEVFHVLTQCQFPPKCRAWKKADLLTLIVETFVALHSKSLKLDPNILASILVEFYETVDAVRDNETEDKNAAMYYKAAVQGTNDRSNRIRRAEIIAPLIQKSSMEFPA
ncbi:hypothetical protein Pan258_27990 [Symmachiella dynata]|uniref:GmrSD restriction endonuclease domain-containing protein n=1 Tax=Symmachiella dynata TaxID=2527995 RepID=UPI001188350B|nr:DUF262 domain-containing protein [Symmachiella dynata]QDT48754.1 hypothetical protein Pan258_27990 [Symmachiella dynata]